MDTRTARRAAEKAARDLINNRATLIGELGVAQAERAQLEADVTTAADRGRQLVAAAEAEASRLLETAQSCVRDAEQRYTDVYGAATAAGWAPADLATLGFQPADSSTGPRRRRTQPAAARASAAALAPTPSTAEHELTVPQQQDHSDNPAVTPA